MSKTIYHEKFTIDQFNINSIGIYVKEILPQKRTLNINYINCFKGNQHEYKKTYFELPYLYVIGYYLYNKQKDIYFYPGFDYSSAYIFCRNSPVYSLNDVLNLIPWERKHLGGICINHRYDQTIWSSFEGLFNFVLSEWYSLNHDLNSEDKIYSEENIKNLKVNDYVCDKINTIAEFIANLTNQPINQEVINKSFKFKNIKQDILDISLKENKYLYSLIDKNSKIYFSTKVINALHRFEYKIL